jgi:hypothetical protein
MTINQFWLIFQYKYAPFELIRGDRRVAFLEETLKTSLKEVYHYDIFQTYDTSEETNVELTMRMAKVSSLF